MVRRNPPAMRSSAASHVARAFNHRMQEPRFEPKGLAERGALGTEAAEIRRVAFVAGDGAPPAPSGVATTSQPTPQ